MGVNVNIPYCFCFVDSILRCYLTSMTGTITTINILIVSLPHNNYCLKWNITPGVYYEDALISTYII